MNRKLSTIAQEITQTWKTPSPHAQPYLSAMLSLSTIHDYYGYDSGESIVTYFLNNASTWRGEDAKRLKTELKNLLKNS